MGADQQFCLRWNNFHSNITSAFESLRDDEDFVDITLACEGRQIKAHKMVLSACSPYFRSLLKGNPCQHPIVFLKDVTFANLTSILDFMYHGEVNVSHNELATFLKTAEALKVRGLAEDEKKKDAEGYNESSSPPPSRGEPPDPGSSPRPEEGGSAPDTHLSGDSPQPPPSKRQRRRSAASLHSAEDNTSETVLSEGQRDSSASVKNEPQDYPEDEDNMLGSSAPVTLEPQDLIKADLEDPDDRSFGPSDSVSISRSQAAMQQLQESFGSFLPGMGQAPSGFLPQGATDLPRPPPYPLEGVQGLPPGISALPGPSMTQGASQEAGQGAAAGQQRCPLCHKSLSRWTSLRRHIEDKHTQGGAHVCPICFHVYRTKNSLHNHLSVYHRGATGSRGRRGRYPSYTVLRPATAHQLAELKAAARRRDLSMASVAADLPGPGPGPGPGPISAPVPVPAPGPAPNPLHAMAPALPEELCLAGHSTAGGFEALLQSDAEASGALHAAPCKSSTTSPQGLASPEVVDE